MSQDQTGEDYDLIDVGRAVAFGICAPFIVPAIVISDALAALRGRLEEVDQVLNDG